MANRICVTYCPYYRDGKEDTGHCYPHRYAVVSGLEAGPGPYVFKNAFPGLKRMFCPRCEFYPEDCDFHNDVEPGSPCGGYIFFEHMLLSKRLTVDEIEGLCAPR